MKKGKECLLPIISHHQKVVMPLAPLKDPWQQVSLVEHKHGPSNDEVRDLRWDWRTGGGELFLPAGRVIPMFYTNRN